MLLALLFLTLGLAVELLSGIDIPKFKDDLFIPPTMPQSGSDYYEIAARQFKQQVLPTGFPQTTVWGYGSANHPETFSYPAYTIENQINQKIRVKWINNLVDESGDYLPHLFTVDQTLNWANPENPDTSSNILEPYTGPVPISVHVHGAKTTEDSDGHPLAWYLPKAKNIPANYSYYGSYYSQFKKIAPAGKKWDIGSLVATYPNQQRAATLWYHDHTFGLTRLNVYSGLSGFYIIRDSSNSKLKLPGDDRPIDLSKTIYEIPLLIQDRSFLPNGEFFYPTDRAFFEGVDLDVPFTDQPSCPTPPSDQTLRSDVPPFWNPETFGQTIVVNGKTWPKVDVEPRRYRFRVLNGCNARFLILNLNGLPFHIIGNDGGFLPKVVTVEDLYLAPAERFDVIVDFSDFDGGDSVDLLNLGPDEPYGGGSPGDGSFDSADPETTGLVLRFNIVNATSKDRSRNLKSLNLPPLPKFSYTLENLLRPRVVALREEESSTVPVSLNSDETLLQLDCESEVKFGPTRGTLGTSEGGFMFRDEVTETPTAGKVEVWEIINYTEDVHPVHIHLVAFKIINRQSWDVETETPVGPVTAPYPWELGFKDTLMVFPGQVTRIAMSFPIAGNYIWHCHILEHEDNEMMRPILVQRADLANYAKNGKSTAKPRISGKHKISTRSKHKKSKH